MKTKPIRIRPNTNRLRQLVRDHGDIWIMEGDPRPMPCFDGHTGAAVRTIDNTHSRNVPLDVVQPIVKERK